MLKNSYQGTEIGWFINCFRSERLAAEGLFTRLVSERRCQAKLVLNTEISKNSRSQQKEYMFQFANIIIEEVHIFEELCEVHKPQNSLVIVALVSARWWKIVKAYHRD